MKKRLFSSCPSGQEYVVSVSFGKDSLCMLLRLLEENWPITLVIFYNTGMEFACVYDMRDKVLPLIKEKGITYIELSPPESMEYLMCEKEVHKRNGNVQRGRWWCGGACRWMTRYKLDAIDRYTKNAITYVGIAADELNRLEHKVAKEENKVYPLVEWGMTEADCLRYCYDRGYDFSENGIRMYDYFDRLSCFCCKNKNLKELYNIYKMFPKYWQRLSDLQNRIPIPMKGPGKSVSELETRFCIQKEMEDMQYTIDDFLF